MENNLTMSQPCSLKRKRPPKIKIPDVLQEIKIENNNSYENTDTQVRFSPSPVKNDVGSCFGDVGFVGFCSVKGKKKFMEDAHVIVPSNGGDHSKSFFGVYDGHGGRKAAEFVAENLHKNVIEMIDNRGESMDKEEAVKAAYLRTDREFLEQNVGSGTCCVTVVVDGSEIVVSNLGDCRAVLCRGGVAEALTKDHRASREDERKRIENKGGYVEIHKGAWRVHGILSVSRSIGDSHLKDWVVAEPDTKICDVTPDMDFLLLASDGLWDEVGNQEAVDKVLNCHSVETKKPEVQRDDPLLDHHKQISVNENGHEHLCVSTSHSPKVKRVSLVKKQKMTTLSPRYRKTKNADALHNGRYDFDTENESPLAKVSLFQCSNVKIQSPSQETKRPNHGRHVASCKELVKDGLSDFDIENESPPAKVRKLSLFQRPNAKIHPLSQENSQPKNGGLVAACKELVNLAVTRGSLDDITVMIIDLNHFKGGLN